MPGGGPDGVDGGGRRTGTPGVPGGGADGVDGGARIKADGVLGKATGGWVKRP